MTHIRQYVHSCIVTVLLLVAAPSHASTCTFASGAINLGTVSSFVVATTPQSVTGTSGYKCVGSLLSVLGAQSTSVKILSSTNNMRLLSATTDGSIQYQMCKSSSCTNDILDTNSEVTWTAVTFLDLLGLFSAPDGTLPITVKTLTSNVPEGLYEDTVQLYWTYTHCTIGLTPLLCYGKTAYATTSIKVSLIVKKDCYINDAPDVNFGAAPMPSQFTSKSSTITTRCTLGTTYSVNLASSNPVAGNWRQMSASVNGSTYYLQYQLYRADNSVWTHLSDYNDTGTGIPQLIPFTAGVNTAQPNLPAGNYKDVVTVTLTY